MVTRPRPTPADPSSLQLTLDALSSPIRREILWMVWATELSAGEIAAAFEVSAGTISSHLTALRNAGLVVVRRDGNFRRYRADRRAMESVLPVLAASGDRWQTADNLPERDLAEASVQQWVTVTTQVPLDQQQAFDAFTSGDRYSEWLGVPVRLEEGRFAAELEWGTRVRGHYEVVSPPELIAMRWDFDDDAVPFPGRQLVAYLRFAATDDGCRIEVHQRATDATQVEFLSGAWAMVLGRLRDSVARSTPRRPRAPRPKRAGDASAR